MSRAALVKLVTGIVQQITRDPQFLAGRLKYQGVFRGFVEDVVDPQQRGRVRVRIPPVNHDTPTALLPWAERSFQDAGPDYGEFIPLKAGEHKPTGHTGDAVWIMFEGGDPSKPVVLGLWYSAPRNRGEGPRQDKAPKGHNRRRVMKTRHGTTIEIGDEPADSEIKIVMPDGHKVHMRESDGGRGIHVNTAGGHKFSIQDEHPGQSRNIPQNEYDKSRDAAFHVLDPGPNPPPGVFASEKREIIPHRPKKPADGVVKTGTEQPAVGFGQKGVCIETSDGHQVHIRDIENPGMTLRTKDGHRIEMLDDPNTLEMVTSDGNNRVKITEGGGILVACPGQTITMNAHTFVLNASSQFTINTPSFDLNEA